MYKRQLLDKIKCICPLHGLSWRQDFMYFIDKYDKWSRYEPEVDGVLICYASMYGNTESAAQALAAKIVQKGVKDVKVVDVSNTHVSYLISDAWKYSHIVLALSLIHILEHIGAKETYNPEGVIII